MKNLFFGLIAALVMFGADYAHAQCKKNSGIQVQEYLYDYSVDGGGNATSKTLSSKAGYKPIPTGAIVLGVDYHVLTAVSGSSSTVSWGFTGDEDGYSGTAIAEASLTTNAVGNSSRTANSVLWDDTNDAPVYKYISSSSAGAFIMDIGTADLTAGKIQFFVKYLCPSL